MAIFVSSCIPLAIYQAGSFSIDGLVFGLSFLIISYFLYMVFCEDNSKRKNILIFYSLIVILSLIKPNYIIFGILGLIIPKNKLKINDYIIIIGCIIILLVITICYTHYYSIDALNMSWRREYFIGMHVNQTEQLNFILHNKKNVLILFSSIIYEIPRLIGELFQLSVDKHGI